MRSGWFHSVFPTVVQFCLMPEGTILMVIEHSSMKYLFLFILSSAQNQQEI